jgi:hypothetical protein
MPIPVVDFYPKPFSDIPTQDNPAYGDSECIIITRNNDINIFGKSKVLNFLINVLHYVPHQSESVRKVAIFYKHKEAVEYAEFFATRFINWKGK